MQTGGLVVVCRLSCHSFINRTLPDALLGI
jgi:hypothetical protein